MEKASGDIEIPIASTSGKQLVKTFYSTQRYFTFGISDEEASKFPVRYMTEFCICKKDDPSDIWWANILSG